MIKTASLFSGIGGFDIAVNQYYNTETQWFCDNDVHSQLVLNEHWKGTPIVPDIREIDRGFGTVDILHGGYPCQPFSSAGFKKGKVDERYLWPEFTRVIEILEPRVVILENVEGHVKIGFDRTLRDFAKMGYDVRWGVIRASDAGAPHKRTRLFALAAHSGFPGAGWNGRTVPREEVEGREHKKDSIPFKPFSEIVTDSNRKRFNRRKSLVWEGRRERLEGSSKITSDTYRERQQRDTLTNGRVEGSINSENLGEAFYGKYERAIRRWEYLTETYAPYPTDENGRLDPDFVEWMMGYPIGWTDGLAFTNRIKLLGNAIVPHQAYLAIELLNEAE